ncbi:MAG: hypothetical protein IJW28_00915, partial [Clostridia bacterium]|nr:hypothetical protein [Clostridia bacterium]
LLKMLASEDISYRDISQQLVLMGCSNDDFMDVIVDACSLGVSTRAIDYCRAVNEKETYSEEMEEALDIKYKQAQKCEESYSLTKTDKKEHSAKQEKNKRTLKDIRIETQYEKWQDTAEAMKNCSVFHMTNEELIPLVDQFNGVVPKEHMQSLMNYIHNTLMMKKEGKEQQKEKEVISYIPKLLTLLASEKLSDKDITQQLIAMGCPAEQVLDVAHGACTLAVNSRAAKYFRTVNAKNPYSSELESALDYVQIKAKECEDKYSRNPSNEGM